ncbi:MAG: ABC transporter ATP-binding protein [Chloroflexi bacterium]|nr:MAG: ABC transporter ATP-binding protein [Chloroflexota bacterium]
MLLETRQLSRTFGGVHAVDRVDLAVAAGQAFGLIGPNGAGKTTLINLISGHLRADGGSVLLDGATVTRLAPHELTARGIARTFQGVRLFKGLTVFDNVLVGRHARMRSDVVRHLVPRRSRADPDRERAMGLLERVGLRRRAGALAGELAYGDQRRLEIARALASEPRVLILDEPAAGMNPSESGRLRELMRALVAEGITIVLIEHDVGLVMGTCERVAVLNFGRKIAEGSPAEVRASAAVREAYLGVEDVA